MGWCREEAQARANQTNAKYDEAEQKSQAWMVAKDQAQQHKRQWHTFWQQAMVSSQPPPSGPHSHLPLTSLSPPSKPLKPTCIPFLSLLVSCYASLAHVSPPPPPPAPQPPHTLPHLLM